MISLQDYLEHWKLHYGQVPVPDDELTDDMRAAAADLLERVNGLLAMFGVQRRCVSGWRPTAVNAWMCEEHKRNPAAPAAATHSKHISCNGIDVADVGGELDRWLDEHPEVLERFGLWREDPSKTVDWCHLQNVQYGSWVEDKPRTFMS